MDADMEHDELDWGDVDAPMPDDDAISLGGADEDDDLAALQKYQAPRAAAQGDDAPADPNPAPAAPAAPADEAAPSSAPPDNQSAGPLPQPAPRPDPPRPRRERDRERDYRDREYRERDRDERRQRTEGSSSSASSNARPPPPPPPQSRSRGAHNQMPAGNMALPAKPQLIHSTSYGGYQQPIEAPAQRPARDRARSDDPPPPPPAAQRISRDELDGLPSEWQICTSSKGADFFYNRLTQETQWQRPKLGKPSPPPPRGPQQSARPPPRTDSYGPGPGRHDSAADYRAGSDPDPRHYPSAPAPPEPSSSAWPAARRDYPPAAPPAADERMLRRGGQHYSPEQTRGRREPAPPVPRPQSPPLPRRHSLSPPARYEVKRGSNSWRPEDDAPRGVAAAGKWQHDQFAERDRERERERGRAPERGRVQQDQNGPSNRNRRPPRARSVENNSSSSNNNTNANAIAPRAPAADAPRRRSPPPPPPPPTLLPSPPQSVPTLASTSATTSPLRPPTPPREREESPVKEGVKRPREEDEAPKAQPLAAPPQEEVDAKRRRTDSDPDSTRARRTPPAKDIGVAHDDDSPRKRKPLPPQGELFQAKRVPPPSPSPAKPREDLQPLPHPHPHPHPPAPRREPSFRGPAADYKQERDRDRLPSGPRADREFRTRRDSMGRGEHPPAPPQPQRSPTFNVNGRSPLPPSGPPLHVDTSGPRQSRFGPPQQRNSPAGEWNQHPLPPREVAGRPPRMDVGALLDCAPWTVFDGAVLQLQASPMENGRALHPERERRGPPPRQARYGASPHTGAPPPLPSPGPGPGPIPVASQQGFYQNTGPSRSPHISPALDRNQMPLPPSYVQQRPNRGAEFPMRDQGPPPPPRGNQNNWNDRPRPTRNERSASFRAEGGHYRRSRSASPHRQYAPPPPGDNMMPSQDWGRGPPPPPHRSPEQRLVNGMHPERAGLVSGAGAPPPGVAGPSRQPSFYPPAHDRERERDRDRDRERGPPPGKMRHDALGLDPRGMQVPPPPLERKASLIDRISDPNESAWAGDADARMDDAAAADGGEGPGGGGFRRMRSNANGRYPPRRGTGRRQHGHVHGR